MTRNEAIQLGLKKYNTGRPCNNGHNSDRYTSTGGCCQCQKDVVYKRRKQLSKQIAATKDGRAFIECYVPRDQVAAIRQYVETLNYMYGAEDGGRFVPFFPGVRVSAAEIEYTRTGKLQEADAQGAAAQERTMDGWAP